MRRPTLASRLYVLAHVAAGGFAFWLMSLPWTHDPQWLSASTGIKGDLCILAGGAVLMLQLFTDDAVKARRSRHRPLVPASGRPEARARLR